MDLKLYYQKTRELEQNFKTAFPIVVSQETPDGGTSGVMTEVPIHVAARMIVDGRAVLASEQESEQFLAKKLEAKNIADQLEASKRMQVRVVSENDLRKTRKPSSKS